MAAATGPVTEAQLQRRSLESWVKRGVAAADSTSYTLTDQGRALVMLPWPGTKPAVQAAQVWRQDRTGRRDHKHQRGGAGLTEIVKATGIFQSISFDGEMVTYRRMLTTARIPLSSVASVEHNVTGSALTVVDTGGTRYRVAVWSGGRAVRDAIESAKRRQ